jgi:hypothetical protein
MSGTEGIPATHGEEDVKCMTTDRGKRLMGSPPARPGDPRHIRPAAGKIGMGEMAQELGLHWSITSRLVATLAVAV